MKDKPLLPIKVGLYVTRCGMPAEVICANGEFAFGFYGYDPKDAMWMPDTGEHRFKKYDLVARRPK